MAIQVCFSFAAYAKNLIQHLKNSNIPVENGLSETEFSDIESRFNFRFPPDLRSVLQEGLPVGPGFPNWRSSSRQQLQIRVNLPVSGICREVSRAGFWVGSWGERPGSVEIAVYLAGLKLKDSPILVPVYRDFYIPSSPFLAGNPVFEVKGGDVAVSGFDIVGFFREFGMAPPPWTATEPRRVEFWTEIAAEQGWWRGGEVGVFLENMLLRLRDGGWKEEEVREMMLMDGGNQGMGSCESHVMEDEEEDVVRHVRVLSWKLLGAGWSMEDVVDSLGLDGDCEDDHSYETIVEDSVLYTCLDLGELLTNSL